MAKTVSLVILPYYDVDFSYVLSLSEGRVCTQAYLKSITHVKLQFGAKGFQKKFSIAKKRGVYKGRKPSLTPEQTQAIKQRILTGDKK